MAWTTRHFLGLRTWCAVGLSIVSLAADQPPRTGPETEKRFPPLNVPPAFRATLFACDPLIEYPSAVALGPRHGSIFVAVDYMTGLGTEIVRRDEIRLVEDTDRDGYANRAMVYADEFNSIQGLTYHDGTVYVMHAPFLTALQDTDGDGKADARRDLVTGLGLPPEQNPVRLHCANGVVMGHDGWLYLALGDHGCAVTRPEGDRLVLQGGGILRCRSDGRDLHVLATGLRNIYDVALDDELNVFLRDNENDGGDYKIRVYHSFFGSDHGYPHLYHERPLEALPALADLGLGSSAGGLFYLETAFPTEYRGTLFFCEWGRAIVNCRPQRSRSSFAPVKELEFAFAADNDPYGFKPTDLVVERDGSLIVADWADGQRPKRGRGRIYRITSSSGQSSNPSESETVKPGPQMAGLEQWLAQLDSHSYYERIEAQAALARKGREGMKALDEALRKGQLSARGRLHAVWIMARIGGQGSVESLLNFAQTDQDPRVRGQAVRAVADITDPMLKQHRLDAGPGDAHLAARLAELAARDQDSRVVLEVIIALGRLRWADAPAWLRDTLRKTDHALLHAAMQTLRRCHNWSAVLNLLDEADNQPIRALALRALADCAQPIVVDGLIDRLRNEENSSRRREYADALTRVHRKPGPRDYWGYRPAPRPANTVAWDRTDAIEEALDRLLGDPDRMVRLAVLRRMQRERVPTRPATLDHWLREERNQDCVGAILQSMGEHPSDQVRNALTGVIAGREHVLTNRLAALTLFAGGLDGSSEGRLLDLAQSIEDGPVLARALRHTAKRPQLEASSLLLAKLNSPEPVVRAAAVEALAERQVSEANDSVCGLLEDPDLRVRLAAASAAGTLQIHSATASLFKLAQDADPALRRASLDSLRLLKEPRAVPLAVAALSDRETQLTALQCLTDLGGPPQLKSVVELASREPSVEVLSSVMRLLATWSREQPAAQRDELEHAVAQLQGTSGALVRWKTAGPFSADAAAALVQQLTSLQEVELDENTQRWQTLLATGPESRLALRSANSAAAETVWVAYTDLQVSEPTSAQFLISSRSAVRIWLNGQSVHQRDEARAGATDPDQFEGRLRTGANRLILHVSTSEGPGFNLRFRRKSFAAEHEQLTQAALSHSGSVERGRKLFFDLEKSQCLKCHRLAGQGELIGPELTGIGGRFSRIHIIESILEPSRTIAPSFQMVGLILKDGRELNGILMAEKDGTLTLGDNQGERHLIEQAAIKEQRMQSLSAMPEGLEKGLTTEEFIDLIAFLVSQKETQSR